MTDLKRGTLGSCTRLKRNEEPDVLLVVPSIKRAAMQE